MPEAGKPQITSKNPTKLRRYFTSDSYPKQVFRLAAFKVNLALLMIVKESSAKIVSGDFEMPSNSAMEEMISKELEWNFDEDKVAAEIKRHYPGWSEEHVYDEVDKLGDIYEDELSNHLEPIIKATVSEISPPKSA